MTALKDIEKIETTGLWRPDVDAQRIEVFVAVGDGSLIITDISNTALSHWALAAVQRRNPGKRPARYAPGQDSVEELEIEDPTMIEAIERIRAAIDRARPHPGRIRLMSLAVILCAVLALAVLWVPRALQDHTLSVLPTTQKTAIGARMLERIEALTGPACTEPRALTALETLQRRTLPDGAVRVVVLPNLPKASLNLPGGLIVLSADLLDPASSPEAVAGHLTAAHLREDTSGSLRTYLDFAGFRETFHILTRGEVTPETVRGYVNHRLTTPAPAVDPELLLARLEAIDVPALPYALSIGVAPDANHPLAQEIPAGSTPPPLLSDTTWLTLTNICQ